jgi:hypothetical protein
VVNDQLPPICQDLECGSQATAVIDRGGHLIGGCDRKYAMGFGVKTKIPSSADRALRRARPIAERLGLKIRSNSYRFDTSLLVVVNREGHIVRIYKNAGIKDVPSIVGSLEDSELCPP